ncbi:WO-orf5-like protein [Wolbachia endosymbiont of Armadillidium vulgare str. wVulC]|uniref:Transposase n=1 Tax=Wolbachia endosymbiont of Armadillidium arcangelii TaxID=3158571 RepID=A0AAU7Q260_9RICK|nr:WO-orf5-like protein [Wolbachia endosymbiont of Armadillidium vulgare str. wVulC]OJH31597.1 hypothetical protein Wxf_00991 [Wolbachia endosymbiont of Armadillidium vulgare]KLT22361.1 WO-orf5-like phage protein [Wolbachia endosymbiont of Armadillidium vulgare str. wVulC]KLT22946.1 WO-orf5-like protein [Wolbachia endosymbiont of Armadillidium vulgare str. wVulC]OJH32181.1 hypothetical protein Wxf_01606 [Wolbachia endosymbiont of Armadillidium vulgare]
MASGLGIISRKRSKGVMLHTAFAVSTEGLALGIKNLLETTCF